MSSSSETSKVGRVLALLFAVLMTTVVFAPVAGAATPSGHDVSRDAVDASRHDVQRSDEQSFSSQTGEDVSIDDATLDANGTVEVIVRVEEFEVPDASTMSAGAVVDELKAHAEKTQKPVVDYAKSTDGVEVLNEYWVTNAVLLELDTDEVDVRELVGQQGVTGVHQNFEVKAPEPVEDDDASEAASDTTYGLDQINATEVWDEHGTKGAGAKVAVLDTGVDASHPDIDLHTEDPTDETYPGGWAEFDDDGNQVEGSTPYDSSDHGTHVSGTVAGGAANGTAIGVAPDAKLMHGLVLQSGSGSFGQIIGGIEWAVEEDADVISMSLGATGFYSSLVDPIQNAEDAGTIVVAAAGNDGPETSSSPGNVYDSFTIGASDSNRDIGYFSSGDVVRTERDWGDAALDHWPSEYVVPDVSAPGVGTYSTLPGGEYGEKSGTSMATPHVSGVVALMVSASGGDLSPDEIETALVDSATKPDDAPAEKDTRYGHGIVDALAATTSVAAEQGVSGTVTDAGGDSLTDASVSLSSGAETATDADGEYLVRTLAGTYDVTVSEFGYESSTAEVDVSDGEMTTHDASLDPALATEVTDPQDAKIAAGNATSVTYRTAHADSVTVTRAGNDGEVTLSVDGEEREFGESVSLDSSDDNTVEVSVGTTAGNDASITLQHAVKGMGDTTTFETGPTSVVSQPSHVAIVDSTGSEHAAAVRTAVDENVPTDYFVSVVSPSEAASNPDAYDVLAVHRVGSNVDLESFADATSHPETGVVYLDQWGETSNGVAALSDATQNPVVTGQQTESDPPEYEVVTDHAIFDGVANTGESITIHEHSRGDLAWFDRYRGTTLATASDGGSALGTGVAVDESSQTVLLSSLGRSSTVRNSQVTEEADALLGNAVTYADSLPPAWFESTQPDHVAPGESFAVDLAADDLREVNVTLTDASTATPDDLTLSVDGSEREFGEWHDVDESAETVTLEVDTADGTVGSVGLSVGVAGNDDSVELLSGPTAVYEKPLVVPEDVDTIQEAVDLAPAGTTVEVAAGTYSDPVTISTPGVTLTAHGDERPTIDSFIGGFYEPVVHVDAPNVTVERVDVVASGFAPDGIAVDRANATIRNVSVSGAAHGVIIGGAYSEASGSVVRDVEISDGASLLAIGVTVGEADDSYVYNASISGQDSGIDVYDSTGTVVENNSVTNSTVGITSFLADQLRVAGNEIDNASVGIQLEAFVTPETVSGNEISNVSEGIYVEGTNTGGPIVENDISGEYGIWVERGDAPALDIRHNDLSETNVSVGSGLDGSLRATMNYHGDRAGDESFVEGDVVYEPFLTAPPEEIDAEDPRQFGVDLSLDAGEVYGVSVPGTTSQTVADIFDDEFEGVVYGFDASEQSWTQLTGDDDVAALQGLVVVAESDGRMTISHHVGDGGPGAPGQRTLVEGWNFVGSPEYGDLDSAFDLSTVEPGFAMAPFEAPDSQPGPSAGFDGVYRFDGADPTTPATSAYEGYFVFAESEGTLPSYVVPSPTPTELYEGIGLYSDGSTANDSDADADAGPSEASVDAVLSTVDGMDREDARATLAQVVYRELGDAVTASDGSRRGLNETAAAIVADAPAEHRELVEDATQDALQRVLGDEMSVDADGTSADADQQSAETDDASDAVTGPVTANVAG